VTAERRIVSCVGIQRSLKVVHQITRDQSEQRLPAFGRDTWIAARRWRRRSSRSSSPMLILSVCPPSAPEGGRLLLEASKPSRQPLRGAREENRTPDLRITSPVNLVYYVDNYIRLCCSEAVSVTCRSDALQPVIENF
jgi:hypothetical protein